VPASLQVPDGNKVEFHAYAAGVQIHTATNFTDRFDEAGLDLYAFRLGPRVGHAGDFVDVPGDEVVVRFPRDLLDQDAKQQESVVGVLPLGAGLEPRTALTAAP
jgi:hypothetical protein